MFNYIHTFFYYPTNVKYQMFEVNTNNILKRNKKLTYLSYDVCKHSITQVCIISLYTITVDTELNALINSLLWTFIAI